MNVKRISLALVFSAFSTLAIAAPTMTMVQVNQLDPHNNPSANIKQINGQSASACAKACEENAQCIATYYVNQQCWLKNAIKAPEQKLFESGVGGIKAIVIQ